MRRRRRAQSDSLDMMLDTITNAFGGIVLLALLVTLILGQQKPYQDTGRNSQQAAAIADLESEIQRLNQDKIELESITAKRQLMLAMFQDNQNEGLVTELVDIQSREQEISRQLDSQQNKLAEFSNRVSDRNEALRQTREQIKAAEEQIMVLQSEIDDEKQRRTRSMETPRETVTNKPMTVVFVKDRQLFIFDANYGVGEFKLNTQQFETTSVSNADLVRMDQTAYRTIPNRGIPLDSETKIKSGLARFAADQVHLVLIVTPESFDQFAVVRDACVAQGLNHRVLPLDKGPVHEGRSSRASTAQ